MQEIRKLEQALRRRMRDSLLEITGDKEIKIATRATYNGGRVEIVHLCRDAITLWFELPWAKSRPYTIEGDCLVTSEERLEFAAAELTFTCSSFALCYACDSAALNRVRSFVGMPPRFGSPTLPRLGKELVVKGMRFADYYLLTQRIPLPKLMPCVAPHYVEVHERVYLFHPSWSQHFFEPPATPPVIPLSHLFREPVGHPNTLELLQ